ncbi:hypothetical protein HY638_04575 [Candidatus Woesearchaeota archaeon]|nr:hypothetical protein [Candidatus Woesearchaeota archaeon]
MGAKRALLLALLALISLFIVSCVFDFDKDGYPSNIDCDDRNPDVNPGAIEVCNSIDDNCDGGVDEGCEVCSCPEIYMPVCGSDGVTYGNQCEADCKNVEILHSGECACGDGYVTPPEQCDPTAPTPPFYCGDEETCTKECRCESGPFCGNGICEEGEADYCPPCVYQIPACKMPCLAGTCPEDCEVSCPEFPIVSVGDPEDFDEGNMDILYSEAKQVGNVLQLKTTVRADIENSVLPDYLGYIFFIDADNDPNTGNPLNGIGVDYNVHIQYNMGSWSVPIYPTSGQLVPNFEPKAISIRGSAYGLLPLGAIGNPTKIKFFVGGISNEVPGGDQTEVVELSIDYSKPGYGISINADKYVFSESPKSINLRPDGERRILSVSGSQGSGSFRTQNRLGYNAARVDIANIEGNQVWNNFPLLTETHNSDWSVITRFDSSCDVLVDDFIMGVSGNLYKYGRVAFVFPDEMTAQFPGRLDYYTFKYKEGIEKYEIPKVSHYALEIEKELTGMPNHWGDYDNQLFVFNYPACGWAGQPIYIGFGCLLVEGTDVPRWGVLYHELGHDFLIYIFSDKFPGLYEYDWNRYGEGWATLLGMYSINKLIERSGQYGFNADTTNTLMDQFDSFQSYKNDLNDYTNNGYFYPDDPHEPNSKLFDANIMDGIFVEIAEDSSVNPYGWEVYPRFFKAFHPDYWYLYDTVGVGKGETFIVAAMSAATGTDLRQKFRGWRFPVNDAYYDQISPVLRGIIDGEVLERGVAKKEFKVVTVPPDVENPTQ